MVNTRKYLNIDEYVEVLYRRIWYILIPFLVISLAAAGYALLAPRKYLASTMILVTPQRVPADYVRSTITQGIDQRLHSISQEILSRTRLEKIIAEFKLYEEERQSMTQEEVIEIMRRDIWVKMGGKEGYFSISYQGKDPKVVAMVTNKLASLYIEENLKFREQQAQGTSEFLTLELNGTREKLEEKEKAITEFKRKYLPELPEQRESNLKVLGQLQLEQQRISDSLKAAQDRKVVVQKQVAELKALAAQLSKAEKGQEEKPLPVSSPFLVSEIPSSPAPKPEKPSPEELLFAQMKNQLKDLRGRYTALHPDVIALQRKIEDLEKAPRAQKMEPPKIEEAKGKVPPPVVAYAPAKKEEKPETDTGLFYKEIESQLFVVEAEIQRLKEEDGKVKQKIARFQGRIENAPVRELAMIAMTRDYSNLKSNYERLLQRSTEAQQSENLERRQKGEQFRVMDPAKIPEKPFRPNIPKILLVGLLLGIGSGVGLALVREQTDRSFRDPEDLEATLGLRVVATIPRVKMKSVHSAT